MTARKVFGWHVFVLSCALVLIFPPLAWLTILPAFAALEYACPLPKRTARHAKH